jgi:glycine cleavage system H protein
MLIPEELKYTREHEWVRVEGNIGTVGITDFAQSELGDIVFVDLNKKLTEVTQGQVFGTIEAVKTVSDLFAPLSGKIIEFNLNLETNAEV